jgi:hypothetical protein
MFRTARAAACAAFLCFPLVADAYVIDGASSTGWLAIPYVTSPDFPDDQKTGADEADIVGDTTYPALQTGFDDAGTPSLTDGNLAFRMRFGADENPPGFKHVAVVGLDVDLNASIDILIVVDNKGGTPEIAIRPVDGLGTSADTTAIDTSGGTSYAQTPGSNYSWLSVSALDPGPADLDADGADDFYLSFQVPFADLVSQLDLLGFTGFDQNSQVSYVAGSSTNSKSVNQDWSGIDGSAASWSQPWSAGGALSSVVAVPEPSTAALLATGMLMLTVAGRRRD